MFEKEIKFIVDYNLNKIKSLGSFISFEKLAGSGVHPAIIQYISGELDFLISEDRKKLLQQSVFDYSVPEAVKYFNLIAQEVKKSKKIAYEDLKNLIVQAVSFNISFLVRPRWSLSKLVFNEVDSKPTTEIKQTMNYIYYNEYLKSIFLSYLVKRKLETLSLTEFESILSKIDNEVISADQQKMVDYSLYQMAEFFNPDSPDNRNGLSKGSSGGIYKNLLPLYGIEMFLKEKNIQEYILRLKKAYPDTAKHKLEVEEIRRVIYSKIPVETDSSFVQEKVQQVDLIAEEEPKEEFREEMIIEEKINLEEPDEQEDHISDDLDIEIKSKANKDEIDEKEIKEDQISEEEFNFDATLDEDLFSLYEEGISSKDENQPETEQGDETKESELTSKEVIDSLYDFEEETNQLLKEFENEIPEEHIEKEIAEPEDTDKEYEKGEGDDASLLVDDFMKNAEQNNNDENAEEEGEEAETENIHEETGYEYKPQEKYLFDFISDKDIRKIISSVFNNDRDDFLSTVDKIAECKNYEEATEILKGVFLTYRVNPYSKEAVALTNSVANYFNQA